MNREIPSLEAREEGAEDSSRRRKAARTPTKEVAAQVGLGDDESVKHEQERVSPSFLSPTDSEPKRCASSGKETRADPPPQNARQESQSQKKGGRGVIPRRDL